MTRSGEVAMRECPNPWCPDIRGRHIIWDRYKRHVHCIDCQVKGRDGKDDAEAVDLWNLPAGSERTSACTEATLREALEAAEAIIASDYVPGSAQFQPIPPERALRLIRAALSELGRPA